MIVLDASALLEVLLRTPQGEAVAGRLLDPDESLHAPHLIDLEILQALRRFARSRDLEAHRGLQAVEDLAAFPLTRYPHGPLRERIWELHPQMTAYDAAYVALAEALEAPLLTRDAALAAARGHSARIEVV